ncbi:hypothetical protein COBT_001890, partial [Conglomerata obtusa]
NCMDKITDYAIVLRDIMPIISEDLANRSIIICLKFQDEKLKNEWEVPLDNTIKMTDFKGKGNFEITRITTRLTTDQYLYQSKSNIKLGKLYIIQPNSDGCITRDYHYVD